MNAIIEGNNIFSIGIYNEKECIGVVASKYLEIEKTAELAAQKAEEFYTEKEKYLERLIEAGLEVKPKTQEEINVELLLKIQSQEEINKQLMEAVLALNKKLESEDVKDESSDTAVNGPKIRNSTTKAKPSGTNG